MDNEELIGQLRYTAGVAPQVCDFCGQALTTIELPPLSPLLDTAEVSELLCHDCRTARALGMEPVELVDDEG